MRAGRARVGVCTDVAARGLDLPELDLVVHADLPTNPETLLHRSGRTGRAGRKGVCVLIVPHPKRRRAEQVAERGAGARGMVRRARRRTRSARATASGCWTTRCSPSRMRQNGRRRRRCSPGTSRC